MYSVATLHANCLAVICVLILARPHTSQEVLLYYVTPALVPRRLSCIPASQYSPYSQYGVKTLRTQDTSDPRHFGTSAEVSVRHFGTSAEVSGQFGTRAEMSYGHFGTKEDTWHSATLDGKVDECLCNTANYRRVQQLYTPISTRRMLA